MKNRLKRLGEWFQRIRCTALTVNRRLRVGTRTNRAAITGILRATATQDVANLIDAAGTTFTIACAGAALGDLVLVSAGVDLAGLTVTGYVSQADTVAVRVQNESGGAIDLASTTWTAIVIKTAA